MKNQFAGAAMVACTVAAGILWLGRGPVTAQAQTAGPSSGLGSAPSALNLSAMTGKVCYLRYQDGGASSPSSETGTLKQVDDNWVVLDVLSLQRNNVVTGANGKKRPQAVYARANRQQWIASKLIIEASFDANVVVR